MMPLRISSYSSTMASVPPLPALLPARHRSAAAHSHTTHAGPRTSSFPPAAARAACLVGAPRRSYKTSSISFSLSTARRLRKPQRYTAMSAAGPPMANDPPSLKRKNRLVVDSVAGKQMRDPATTPTDGVEEDTHELPVGTFAALTTTLEDGSTAKVEITRVGNAQVYSMGKPSHAIIFAHGFSQRPGNYESLLCTLVLQGYAVIAPSTWVLDVAWPWSQVETAEGFFTSPQKKLQTALLIDTVRSVELAKTLFGVKEYVLMGHSMGGAVALAAGRLLGDDAQLRGVLCLAPAIGPFEETELNPYIHLNSEDGISDLAKLMAGGELTATPVGVVHGGRDIIVPSKNMSHLFEATEGRPHRSVSMLATITSGSHIGFEDSLDVDLPVLRLLDVLLFKIIDYLIFTVDLFNLFDAKEQLAVTKQMAVAWMEGAFSRPPVKLATMQQLVQTPEEEVAMLWSEGSQQAP